jgi:hypothetical protein
MHTKPARELVPGDVFVNPHPSSAIRWAVLCVVPADNGHVALTLGGLGELPPHINRLANASYNGTLELEMVGPVLTPAQQHADELLALVEEFLRDGVRPDAMNRAAALRDLIAPTVPPTVVEVLSRLEEYAGLVTGSEGASSPEAMQARAFVERVRQLGVRANG